MIGRVGAVTLLAITVASSGVAGTATAPTAAASTPHPVATSVAIETLRSGGNAMDAAVASAFVLATADPSSASIGGGGLLLWYDASTRSVWALDFRELAPRRLPVGDAAGARIAVPGFVPGLAAAQERFGELEWNAVLSAAVAVAKEGTRLTPTVASRLAKDAVASAALFGEDVAAPGDEASMRPGDLPAVLAQISDDPLSPFRGSAGRRLISFLAAAGSTMTLADLEGYEPVWRAPIRIDRGDVSIYAFPPPSGGGVTLMQLARTGTELEDAATLREASLRRLSRMGDPERTRFDLSAPLRDIDLPASNDGETEGGSGLAVIDSVGNAAAIVFTTGSRLGSGVITPAGFLMNDSLEDFDASSLRGPNAPEGLRRPGTSMTPVLVTSEGKVRIAAAAGGGGPASSALAAFTMRILNGDDPAESIELARYHHDGVPDRLVLEQTRVPDGLAERLTESGQAVRLIPAIGEIHAVVAGGDGYIALSDPRGGGAPGGY